MLRRHKNLRLFSTLPLSSKSASVIADATSCGKALRLGWFDSHKGYANIEENAKVILRYFQTEMTSEKRG